MSLSANSALLTLLAIIIAKGYNIDIYTKATTDATYTGEGINGSMKIRANTEMKMPTIRMKPSLIGSDVTGIISLQIIAFKVILYGRTSYQIRILNTLAS